MRDTRNNPTRMGALVTAMLDLTTNEFAEEEAERTGRVEACGYLDCVTRIRGDLEKLGFGIECMDDINQDFPYWVYAKTEGARAFAASILNMHRVAAAF